MEPLDVEDGFDVHAHRHGLKLVKQDVDSWHLENRDDDFACPACGEVFDRLLVTSDETVSFGNPPTSPFCLARTPGQLLLLTHPGD